MDMVSGYDKHPPEDDGTPKLPSALKLLIMLVVLAFAYALYRSMSGG